MQLIFYYNPYSEDQNEGANFSPEYWFYVTYDANTNQYTLCQEDGWIGYDVFSHGKYKNIVSLSAVVGENGSGKTALLRGILGLMSRSVVDDPVPQEKREQYLYVVKDEKGDLFVYHKIENGDFVNATSIREGYIYDASRIRGKETVRQDAAISGVLRNTSLVYLTNSHYEKWVSGIYSPDGDIKSITLSPLAIGNVSDQFYKILVFHRNNIVHALDSDYLWKQRLYKFNTYYGIQSILDLRYYKRVNGVIDSKNDRLFLRRSLMGFKVTINTIEGVLSDHDSDFLNYKQERDPWGDEVVIDNNNSPRVYEERIFWNGKIIESLRKRLPEEDRFCRYIYLNLLYEMYTEADEKIPDNLEGIDDAIDCIKRMLSNRKYKNKINKEYYNSALGEIHELIAISDICGRVNNIYPPSDLAYDRHMLFKWGTDACGRFLDFIDRQFYNHYSIVLKYLRLQQDRMSSGQRCLQNFITWLDVLPDIEVVMGNKIQKLHNDMLLMVDEIDLYLHPEWQRCIVNELCKELSELFPKKNIQIIISTHSPLCLSDIPVENTIYLYADEKGFYIKPRPDIAQTFGQEIYMLYRNAFFLSNTMGEYATEIINEVLGEARDLTSGVRSVPNDKIYDSEAIKTKIIDMQNKNKLIGNKIIHNKIESMLRVIIEDLIE